MTGRLKAAPTTPNVEPPEGGPYDPNVGSAFRRTVGPAEAGHYD